MLYQGVVLRSVTKTKGDRTRNLDLCVLNCPWLQPRSCFPTQREFLGTNLRFSQPALLIYFCATTSKLCFEGFLVAVIENAIESLVLL